MNRDITDPELRSKAISARRRATELKKKYNIPTKLKAIRQFCIACVGGSLRDVKLCTFSHCALWPYRFGRPPRIEDLQVPECNSHGQIISYRPYKGFKEETGK